MSLFLQAHFLANEIKTERKSGERRFLIGLFLFFLEKISEAALSTVVAIVMFCHKDSWAALGVGASFPQSDDLSRGIR